MFSEENAVFTLFSAEWHKFERVPLVPGVTDKRENLAAIVDFLCAAGAKNVALLPYNPLGLAMYPRLGKPVTCLPASHGRNTKGILSKPSGKSLRRKPANPNDRTEVGSSG
jgi:hypothetical protein